MSTQKRLIKWMLTSVLLSHLVSAVAESARVTDWLELMPKADLEAIEALPPIDHLAIPEIDENGKLIFEQPAVLSSTNTMPKMANQNIKIAGFIVPIEFTGDMMITEFFLVPYFGACIHVPPPPPNQIIYVKYKKGLKTEILYNPFWVSGRLSIENIKLDIAHSSYSMLASNIEVYEEL
jgi:hypothetical protein